MDYLTERHLDIYNTAIIKIMISKNYDKIIKLFLGGGFSYNF